MGKSKGVDKETIQNKHMLDMSREICTHMNAVLGMAGSMLDTAELGKEQRRYVEMVQNSSERLLALISDFLDFSMGVAEKLRIDIIDFDLRTAVESVVELLLQEASDKGIELASLVHSNLPSSVRGDPWRLRQILINLTSNTLALTKKGGVLIQTILAGETATHVTVHFAVTDSSEYIGNQTDRLSKLPPEVDVSTHDSSEEAGIGLSISKQLCKLMGTKLVVEGEEGKGLTFWFNIVLEKQSHAMPATPLRPEYVHGLHVLIVTDKEINRNVLSHYLDTWGCTHDSAPASEEALKKLQMHAGTPAEFQLALVDLPTPDTNAERLALMIKGDPALQRLLLVLITSLGRRGDADKMQEAGYIALMTKPIMETQLFDCVAAAIGFQYKQDKGERPKLITRHLLKETGQRK